MQLINIMASSIDGKISTHVNESDADRKRYGFVNQDDENFLYDQLKKADAVIVGAETLRANGKAFEVVNQRGVYPHWLVFTNKSFNSDHQFWKQEKLSKFLVSSKTLERQTYWGSNTINLVYGDKKPGKFVYQYLKSLGCLNVLLFGGGRVNSIFYIENLVDVLLLTLAPLLIGSPSASSLLAPNLQKHVQLKLESFQQSKNHVFLKYQVKK